MHVQHIIGAGSQFCMECPTMCGASLYSNRRMFSFLLACDVFLENREITYFIAYNGCSESLCAPDDYNTRLSCLITLLNLTAWTPTTRTRGTLDSH
jgi:hypothetical protein